MREFLHQAVLRHLGAIAVAGGIGLASPSASLLEIPSELMIEVVDETEESSWKEKDRRRLLGLVAQDQRVAVRAHVAEAAGAVEGDSPDEAEALLERLVDDPSARVRQSVSRGLVKLLGRSEPMYRIELVSRWSTSDNVRAREAIARALSARTPMLITDMALSGLCHDPDPRVRRAAVTALAPPLRGGARRVRPDRAGPRRRPRPAHAAHGAAADLAPLLTARAERRPDLLAPCPRSPGHDRHPPAPARLTSAPMPSTPAPGEER